MCTNTHTLIDTNKCVIKSPNCETYSPTNGKCSQCSENFTLKSEDSTCITKTANCMTHSTINGKCTACVEG